MSLQTRERPWEFQAGPSIQAAPVHRRLIEAFGCASPLKLGSTATMSASQKYVVGAPLGPKSRGGVVTVLGGATGPLSVAALAPVPSAIAPAPAATAATSVRRDSAPWLSRMLSCCFDISFSSR